MDFVDQDKTPKPNREPASRWLQAPTANRGRVPCQICQAAQINLQAACQICQAKRKVMLPPGQGIVILHAQLKISYPFAEAKPRFFFNLFKAGLCCVTKAIDRN